MRRWAEETGRPVGALVTPHTLWELAVRWYGNRLDPGWRRRSVGERQRILEDVGLTGEFWNLSADRRDAAR